MVGQPLISFVGVNQEFFYRIHIMSHVILPIVQILKGSVNTFDILCGWGTEIMITTNAMSVNHRMWSSALPL